MAPKEAVDTQACSSKARGATEQALTANLRFPPDRCCAGSAVFKMLVYFF
jgi:hypothetical protein